jgi:putative restriction endonuclease
MRAYVGVTDDNWFRFLASNPELTEVNFWRPRDIRQFSSLAPGEPFIFKTRLRAGNLLVGGGFFEAHVVLRISESWDFFGEGNGVESLKHFRERLSKLRGGPLQRDEDPQIGCILLRDVKFVPPELRIPTPPSFSGNVVQGRSYKYPGEDEVIDTFLHILLGGTTTEPVNCSRATFVPGPVFGDPRLVPTRLGQGAFKALVLDAYQGVCAITRHKIRPTLEAAHIRPVSEGGENAVSNGLLLRSDVHRMFDRGYVSIDPDYQLRVSPSIKSQFGNGEEFYEREGSVIMMPRDESRRPSREYLEWHLSEKFIA